MASATQGKQLDVEPPTVQQRRQRRASLGIVALLLLLLLHPVIFAAPPRQQNPTQEQIIYLPKVVGIFRPQFAYLPHLVREVTIPSPTPTPTQTPIPMNPPQVIVTVASAEILANRNVGTTIFVQVLDGNGVPLAKSSYSVRKLGRTTQQPECCHRCQWSRPSRVYQPHYCTRRGDHQRCLGRAWNTCQYHHRADCPTVQRHRKR
ncbi:MAG: hypothetical protein HC893_07740 [Chloroflexaceae bacterium]|nr:hypothetical protein [Chloroflexaceae bacterium]